MREGDNKLQARVKTIADFLKNVFPDTSSPPNVEKKKRHRDKEHKQMQKRRLSPQSPQHLLLLSYRRPRKEDPFATMKIMTLMTIMMNLSRKMCRRSAGSNSAP